MGHADAPVAVVGAGLSGLVTAHELTKHGIDCIVLERSTRVGGRVHTLTFADGVAAEAHMEEFWEFNPVYELLTDLDLPVEEDIAHSSVIIGGRLHVCRGEGARDPYLEAMFNAPERADFLRWNQCAGNVLAALPVEAGGSDTTPPTLLELSRISFADFVRSTTRTRQVAEWIRIVVESEIAVEWERIAAIDGIAEMRPFLDTPTGFGQRNAHVEGGNQRLIDALVRTLPAGTVRTGCAVTRVSDLGDRVAVSYVDRTGTRTTLTCHEAVITVPGWNLPAIDLDVQMSSLARHALATTAAGSYAKVLLRLDPDAQRDWAHYGAGLFTMLSDGPAGCIYLSDHGDERRDLVLTALVHGRHARRLRDLSSAQAAARVISDLEAITIVHGTTSRTQRLFADLSRHVTDARAYSYQQAVAYWPMRAGRSRFDPAAVALRAPHGRVHLGGDTTECSHSDGAARSALRIASVVAGRLGADDRVSA